MLSDRLPNFFTDARCDADDAIVPCLFIRGVATGRFGFTRANFFASEIGAMTFPFLRIVAASIAITATALAADKVTSEYTSTARKSALNYQTAEGGFTQLCPGLGGYQVVLAAGDDRSWLNVRFGNKEVDLYGDSMEHAGGQFPNKANDVVEWRGAITKNGFRPYAVIYRINSTNPANNGRISRLIVIKLDGANSKVLGHTQGTNEDAQAKALADANR